MNASSPRFRIRLKTMFVACTACGLLTAYVLQRSKLAEQQFADVRHLRLHGIGCVYDYEVENSPMDWRRPWRERWFYPLEEERQFRLKWPREMLGDDFFDNVVMASVNRTPLNPSELDAYRRLRHVHMLSANVDQDDVLGELVQQRELTSLVLGPNHRRWSNQHVSAGCLASVLRQQTDLNELRLLVGFDRAMTAELWAAIASLSRLEYLTLRGWDISQQSLERLSNLYVCTLIGCELPAEFDIGFVDELRGLSIQNCDVDDRWLQNAIVPPRIEALNIAGTKITTQGLLAMKEHRLKHITLGVSQIQPQSVEDLAMFPSLQSIAISGAAKEPAKQLLASALPNIKIE